MTGCAAPGSSLTRVHVSGRLAKPNGDAVPNERVKLVLPAAYGLEGLDAKFGRPGWYGHSDQEALISTDETGSFEYLFDPVSYSIVYFLVPPIGARPKYPPAPYLLVSVPSAMATDAYVVAFPDGEFRYRVIDLRSRRYKTDAKSDSSTPISARIEKRQFRVNGDSECTYGGWSVHVSLRLRANLPDQHR